VATCSRPAGRPGWWNAWTQAGRPASHSQPTTTTTETGDGRAWLRQVINHHHHHLSKDTHRSPIRQVIGFLSICPFSSRLALSSCCSSYLHYFARGDARLLLVRPRDDMDVSTISLIFAIIFFFLGLRTYIRLSLTPTPIRIVAARLLIRLLRLACLQLAPLLPAQQLKLSVYLQFRVACGWELG
jgi:hypothetical protein